MNMLSILETVLPEGCAIKKVKELSGKYKITFCYLGMESTDELSKTTAPKKEKEYCKGVIATALSSIYLNKGDIENTKLWLSRIDRKY